MYWEDKKNKTLERDREKNHDEMERKEEVRSERIELLDGCRRLWAFVSE